MADKTSKKPGFTPLKHGDKVHWSYRSGIGDGIVDSVDTLGETNDTTRYNVRELDHHTGEKSVLKHYGRVLKPGWDHHERTAGGGVRDTRKKGA